MNINHGRFDPKYKSVAFLQEADNIYRTNDYIVKQQINMCFDVNGTAVIMSNDTFYRRTLTRDYLYEEIFLSKGEAIDGRRIRSATYTRKYVE